MGDLVTVARNRLASTRGAGESAYADRAVLPMGETVTRYHVAIDVDDRAGVLAQVATAFAEHGVSIQTVRQEGRGADAQLVVVSHTATDAQLAATVEHLRGMDIVREVTSVMRVEGGDEVTPTADQDPPVARRDRGVPRAARTSRPASRRSPSARAGRPLVQSEWLSGLTRAEVWLKVEGSNPTGSFKDRGMTTAISVAKADGAEAVVCASTGNTSASMAAYAAKAGLTPLVLVPEGKIAAGKMAQAILHGARVIMVRGNFDDCLRTGQAARLGLPGRAGQLGQPGPPRGPEDRGVRDRRLPRRRPRLPPAAGRQRRQHLGLLARLHAVRRPRAGHQAAEGARLPGRGRGAAGDRRAVPGPGHQGDRDPDRQPGVVEARRGGPATSPAGCSRRSRDDQILAAQRELAARDGVFVEPASAAGIAGLLQRVAAGESYAGSTVVVTVTGHGLKDIATALEGVGPLVDHVVDNDVTRRGRGRRAGLSAWPSSTARSGSRCPRPRPTSARASTRSAWPSSCATSSRRRWSVDGPGRRGRPAHGADSVPAGRVPPRRARHARRLRGAGRAARVCGWPAAT